MLFCCVAVVNLFSVSVAISLSSYAWWFCGWQVAGCSAQREAIVSGIWVFGLRSEEAHGFISWVCERPATSKGGLTSMVFWTD